LLSDREEGEARGRAATLREIVDMDVDMIKRFYQIEETTEADANT
jgi:hypothetical protein